MGAGISFKLSNVWYIISPSNIWSSHWFWRIFWVLWNLSLSSPSFKTYIIFIFITYKNLIRHHPCNQKNISPSYTVDGSEIPRPTTVWMVLEPCNLHGIIYLSLNWWVYRISNEPSTVSIRQCSCLRSSRPCEGEYHIAYDSGSSWYRGKKNHGYISDGIFTDPQ